MPETSIKLHAKHRQLVGIRPDHVSGADPKAVKINYGADEDSKSFPRQRQLCRVWLTRSARQNSVKQLKPVTKKMCSPICLHPQALTIALA